MRCPKNAPGTGHARGLQGGACPRHSMGRSSKTLEHLGSKLHRHLPSAGGKKLTEFRGHCSMGRYFPGGAFAVSEKSPRDWLSMALRGVFEGVSALGIQRAVARKPLNILAPKYTGPFPVQGARSSPNFEAIALWEGTFLGVHLRCPKKAPVTGFRWPCEGSSRGCLPSAFKGL